MRVLVTGATGLIGRSLCQVLTGEGHAVVALSRAPEKVRDLAASEIHRWDAQAGPPPQESVEGIDAVVHLAGEPVAAKRWTVEQKRRITESRVLSTRHLVNVLRSAQSKPPCLISGSAVGFYGDRGDEQLYEDSAPGGGYLSEVCKKWEAEAARAREFSVRVVQIRTGVVLSRNGGALEKMLPPFKLGVGGSLGNGKQWFPWIHIDDIVGIFRHALFTSSLVGPANGTAPGIVTNAEFTKELGRVLRRPTFLSVPEFALRLAMGEMADVLFSSQRVFPRAVMETGYDFKYPELRQALDNLLG